MDSSLLDSQLYARAAGHGFLGTLEMFSAPFILIGPAWAWYACLPVALLFALAASKLFPLFAGLHYLSVVLVTVLNLEEWQRLGKLPSDFLLLAGVAIVLYAAGHYFLWQIWLSRRTPMTLETRWFPRSAPHRWKISLRQREQV
jgi:hypothetical protein